MEWQAWVTLTLMVLMVAAMVRNLAGPDMILLGGLSLLLALGILTPTQAFAGFSNPGTLTIAILFVVAAGVRETGALDWLVRTALGSPNSVASAQVRMMLPVAAVSAFINNTPLVAMMVPIVDDWARRIGVSPSKLFIPLSYAAIVGGSCTLIGTATNLVVYGMAVQHEPSLDLGLFDIARLGLPVAAATIAYVLLASRWLLPSRGGRREAFDNAREYTVAMRVEADAPIVGVTVEAAGLRSLPGLFLIEIERSDSEIRPAPGPGVRLHRGDRLVFAGVIDSVRDLQKIRGLVPAEQQTNKLSDARPNRCLVEAVVAANSPLIGLNIRDSRFRTRYNAAIIAVHRQGERVRSKVGDIVPQPGDALLLETNPGFVESFRHDQTFALVSEVDDSTPRRHERAPLALVILVAMVALSALGVIDLLRASFIAAGLMVGTRCLTSEQARRSVDLRVLLTIAAAFGIGAALEQSGAAATVAALIVEGAKPLGPIGLLGAIYLTTVLVSAFITNTAAAVLMFPLAHAAAAGAGLQLEPFMYVLMLAASATFMTPIGYQTNLMVYGPGRYRFSDFIRFGVPLQFVVAIVTLLVANAIWL